MITPEQVRWIMGPVCSAERAAACTPALESMLILAEALTVTRAAAFLAQVAWETGQLRFLVEGEEPAAAYEGRANLGNTVPGYGVRYRGRGFIHLTGADNYARYGNELGIPIFEDPDLAAELDVAAQVAAKFWTNHALNDLADERDFRAITKAINGACTEGAPSWHERRERHYQAALEVLGLTAPLGG